MRPPVRRGRRVSGLKRSRSEDHECTCDRRRGLCRFPRGQAAGIQGHEIWVYDNLVFGHRAAVAPGRLIEGDLLDRGKVEAVLREKRIDAVMHFAAFAYVGESVTDPAKYYHNNVVGTLSLTGSHARRGRLADRLLEHLRHVRRAGAGSHPREPAAAPDQSLRIHQARHRARTGRLCPRLWLGLCRPALLQCVRRLGRWRLWAKTTIPRPT